MPSTPSPTPPTGNGKENTHIQGYFDCGINPAKVACYPSSALIFRQGLDPRPRRLPVTLVLPRTPWDVALTAEPPGRPPETCPICEAIESIWPDPRRMRPVAQPIAGTVRPPPKPPAMPKGLSGPSTPCSQSRGRLRRWSDCRPHRRPDPDLSGIRLFERRISLP